ncbi:MAG: hypothetical protein AB8B53_00700 [Flavobacteriales bacterium]
MKKFQYILGFILFTLAFSFSSMNTTAQTKTLAFPNTSVKMDLPESYKTSTENGFSGLVNPSKGDQFVITAIPAPYNDMKKQFTPEALEATGVKLKESEPYLTNGMVGTLYSATQTQGDITMNKYILIFGNDITTYMIMAVYNLSTPSSEILGYLDSLQL